MKFEILEEKFLFIFGISCFSEIGAVGFAGLRLPVHAMCMWPCDIRCDGSQGFMRQPDI